MSEVNEVERFYMAEWSEDAGFGAMDYFVYARDFDAAQSELSALREELASRNEVIAMKAREVVEAQTAVTGWATKCKAAEQRNAAFVALLERMLRDDDMPVHWFAQSIDKLLTQPTESGASE